MQPLADYSAALQWFQANRGVEVAGPVAEDVSTFALVVMGIRSSDHMHPKLDVGAYCKAFKDACNEIRGRLPAGS
jgi:hypothetical protein